MAQNLISLGIVIIFIGLIIVLIGALTSSHKGETKVAVGGFVGFIPFGFANDKRMLYILLGFMGIALLIFFLLPYILRNQ